MKFVDTNVLLYAISRDAKEYAKTSRAIELLDAPIGELGLSVQVLQEFYVQATRSSRTAGLSPALATQYVEHWLDLPVRWPVDANNRVDQVVRGHRCLLGRGGAESHQAKLGHPDPDDP